SETITIEPEVPSSAVPALIHGSAIGIVSYVKNPITEIATPNKAYEYATAGKAMVVADLPALKTLLGDAATYYEPGNAMDLARGVSTLLYDDELRLRLGREARARISTDRKSTRLNSSHDQISYAVFCLKKKTNTWANYY